MFCEIIRLLDLIFVFSFLQFLESVEVILISRIIFPILKYYKTFLPYYVSFILFSD